MLEFYDNAFKFESQNTNVYAYKAENYRFCGKKTQEHVL